MITHQPRNGFNAMQGARAAFLTFPILTTGDGWVGASLWGGVGRYCISARWITWGLPSSTLTQIHRKSLCWGTGVISALGAENGVQPVNEGGHISHQSPPHTCYQGLNLTYTVTNINGYDGNQQGGALNIPYGLHRRRRMRLFKLN